MINIPWERCKRTPLSCRPGATSTLRGIKRDKPCCSSKIINIAPLNCMYSLHTSDYCVVEEDEDDEGGVKEGESDEELVEGVAHLSSWQII